jgi:hypothetical protein|tara:strand:+ start:936 stop:1271 length:336 start_codon:yes stop_codon:yes gene_type:complete
MIRFTPSISQEEADELDRQEILEGHSLPLSQSILKLADLVTAQCGASQAARSVLLNAWNPDFPIVEIYKLDNTNHAAAINILKARWIEESTLKNLVPDIQDWARTKEAEAE